MSDFVKRVNDVSTHSRLKAAGELIDCETGDAIVSTHSRLKAAGIEAKRKTQNERFQHTAA